MNNYRELFLMQQIYTTLFSFGNKLQVQSDKYYDKLTARQFMVMTSIAHLTENETTFKNIAKKLGTTKQSVRQVITIIENKGYVITVSSQKDKRAINVKITELGKQVMLECAEKGIEFFVDLFKDFSTEEMEILWCLLKKLYRFDGEEQDGFEKEANLEIDEDKAALQKRMLQKFENLRNISKNVRRDKNE